MSEFIPGVQHSYMGWDDGRIIVTEDLILDWIGVTILLGIYHVTIKKIFSTKLLILKSVST